MNDDKAEPPESVEAILAKAARLSRQGVVRPGNSSAEAQLPRSAARRATQDRPEDLSASLAAIVQKVADRSRLEAENPPAEAARTIGSSSGADAERPTAKIAEQKPAKSPAKSSVAADPVVAQPAVPQPAVPQPLVAQPPVAETRALTGAVSSELPDEERRAAIEAAAASAAAEAAAALEWAAIEKAARERAAGDKAAVARADAERTNVDPASAGTALTGPQPDADWAAPVWEQRRRPGATLLRRSVLVGLACCAALASGWVARNWWEATQGDRATGSPVAAVQPREPVPPPFPFAVAQAPTARPSTALPAATANATPPLEPAEAAALNASPPGAGIAAPASPGSSLGVIAEREVGPGPWLVDELARRAGQRSDLRIAGIASDGWAASLTALKQQPRVTVVRYDALQAARRERQAAAPALEIVAPLSTEAVYFIVRADSPLRYIHEIRDRSINVGPLRAGSALTAQTAYRQMFQRAPAAPKFGRLDDVAALERLRSDTSLEVVVTSGAGARAWLQQLPAADAARFRLLELDRENTAGRRLASAFLPVRVPAASLGSFPATAAVTPSTMSFIVTAHGSAVEREPQNRAIAALATSLCAGPLSGPQRSGGAWQGVDPALAPEVGWPYSSVARAVFARCERSGITPAKGATSASTPATS